MNYKNQLILTGEINDVGDAIMVNVPNSYRRGIELAADVLIAKPLHWEGNLTLSTNKIRNFTEYVDNANAWYDDQEPLQISVNLGETDISFSPDITGASNLNIIPFKRASINLMSKYAGRQYIDNTSSRDRSLDPYFVNDLFMSYTFHSKNFEEIRIKLAVNNLLNEKYETDAWVWRYYLGDRYYEQDGYFPQAGTTILAGISVRL